MEEKQPQKHRIGALAIVLLVVFALICDIIGLFPIAKDFTATIFWVISGFFLWKKGLGIFNGKKLAAMAISWVSSMIPVLQEIPVEITAGIIAIIIITRMEEKTGISVISSLSSGKTPSPLNVGGARLPNKDIPLNNGAKRLPSGGLKPINTKMVDMNPPMVK